MRELIPLYINGALTADDKSIFETALKQDQVLKREYFEFHDIESTFDRFEDVSEQHLEQLYKTVLNHVQQISVAKTGTENDIPLHSQTQPVTTAELNRNIEKELESQSKQQPKDQPQKNVSQPSQSSVESLDSNNKAKDSIDLESHMDEVEHESKDFMQMFSSPRIAWIVAAIQFVLLLVVAFFTIPNVTQKTSSNNRVVGKLGEVTTYNVVFADHATQKEIRELLVELDIQIANGPTSIGLYTIFVKGSKEDATKTFNKLKNSSLILLAEPAFI